MKVCQNCDFAYSADRWHCPNCDFEAGQVDGFDAHAPELAYGGGGFNPEHFGELAASEAGNFWFRARNALIVWALGRYAGGASSFLEVGCGTGFVLSGIAVARPEMALSGSEIFVTGLPYAKDRVPGARFMQMDARRIPFKEEFDVVGAFDVLEHIQEDEVVLAQLHRALMPLGMLLITVPQHPWLWSATDERACHVRRYTASELRTKIETAGFDIVRTTSFVTLLLPAMLAARRKKAHAHQDSSDAAELRLPRGLNDFFLAAMGVERKLIQAGINFPVGGSRLVVARKRAE